MNLDKFVNKMKQGSIIFNTIDKLERMQNTYYDKKMAILKVENPNPQQDLKNAFEVVEWVDRTIKEYHLFDEIIGHNNIKRILKSTVDSIFQHKRPVSILLDGS